MTDKDKTDIESALEENIDVICIQIAVRAISPDGYVYESNPCVIQSLINRGWNKN